MKSREKHRLFVFDKLVGNVVTFTDSEHLPAFGSISIQKVLDLKDFQGIHHLPSYLMYQFNDNTGGSMEQLFNKLGTKKGAMAALGSSGMYGILRPVKPEGRSHRWLRCTIVGRKKKKKASVPLFVVTEEEEQKQDQEQATSSSF